MPFLFLPLATSAVLLLAAAAQSQSAPSKRAAPAPIPPPPPAASPAIDPSTENLVDPIAASFLSQPGGVGLSIGVARQGRLLLAKGYGLADAEAKTPANAETLFRIASIGKQLTAAAILKLVEQKKLSLDDTLAELVPEFPTPGHTVTLRQLLAHTSGIPDYTAQEAWFPLVPRELTDAELLATVAGVEFDFEPGQDLKYCNTGYHLLGMIAARAGGAETTSTKAFGEYMQRAHLAPIGLQRSRHDSNQDLIENRAQGYALQDGQLVNDIHLGMSQLGGEGGLLSTGGELVRWSMALTGGQVISKESFALMATATVLPDGRPMRYGLGLEIGEFEGRRRLYTEGGIFGFNSILLWLPDDELHVAVISNGEEVRSEKVADAIAYAVLGIEKAAVIDAPTTPELRARLAGNFRLEDGSMEARIFDEGGRLMCQATDQPAFGLKWQGGEEFRADFDEEVRLVFDADAQGFTLHQGGAKVHADRLL